MRKLLLLCSFALLLGACMPSGVVVSSAPYYRSPGYVYYYADGSCWADDYWHAVCPWNNWGSYGYYRYERGYYYHYPHYHWGYRPSAPPPRTWIRTPTYRGQRYVPPPRVRDHRQQPPRTRPRVRDHR